MPRSGQREKPLRKGSPLSYRERNLGNRVRSIEREKKGSRGTLAHGLYEVKYSVLYFTKTHREKF